MAAKAAALPEFSDILTISQSGEGGDYAHPFDHLIYNHFSRKV